MKLDEQKKYTDVESQWKEHNTGIPGFNDGLNEIFALNIEQERPPLDKWEELKVLIKSKVSWPVHYSHSREFEQGEMHKVLEWMDYLEKKEKERPKQQKGFLFTDVPTFDQKTWERILEEKGLQGLS